MENLLVLLRPLARGVHIIWSALFPWLVLAAFYRLLVPLWNLLITLRALLERLPLMTMTCYGVIASRVNEVRSLLSNRRCPHAIMTTVSPLNIVWVL